MLYVLFFFKQKTAYEMRISDWSSDVCSSDLAQPQPVPQKAVAPPVAAAPPQQVAAVAPPPAYTEQNTAMNHGSPQAWRARAVPPPAGAKPPFVAILIDDAGQNGRAHV